LLTGPGEHGDEGEASRAWHEHETPQTGEFWWSEASIAQKFLPNVVIIIIKKKKRHRIKNLNKPFFQTKNNNNNNEM